jgi:PAS domain S-box-containing protein
MFGNGAAFLGWGLHVTAIRRFAGHAGPILIGPVALVVWCLLCLWPPFMESLAARTHLAAAISGGMTAMMAWDLCRSWTGPRPLRPLILLVCGAQPLTLAARSVMLVVVGPQAYAALSTSVILTGFLQVAAVTLLMIAEAMRRAGVESQREIAAAHAEAAASRDLLARLIEHLPAVVYTARIESNLDCRRVYLSANTERVIGWPRAELEAGDALDARTLREHADLRDALQELLEEGEAWRERQMVRADGSRIWVKRHARIAERFPDGGAELVGTITDITRERNLAAQVQASAKLATLGEMAANLAHELGQPAATMCLAASNAARALRKRGEAAIPDALKRLDRIIDQGERMGTLMQHLKAFARSDPILLGPVAVAKAVEGALVLTAAGLGQEEILVEPEIDPDLPLVQAQLVPLEQVLVNLLLNARDAIRLLPPGAPRRIRLRAARAGEAEVAIEVADSGGGLDAAILPRLFEPFVTTKPMGEGLGLGLSVSHGLMRSMGGTIMARNGPDGAVFTVTLPCAAALVPA